MLNDFFRINLPYGIAKNKDGEWMAFNREYMPLGFNNQILKGNPGESYLDLPIYTKYKRVSEKFLIKIAYSENGIQRNDKGEIIRVFLYNDKTNPCNQSTDKNELWSSYFEKLKNLSKLTKDESKK
jgi:hypothetical protein